MNARQLISLLSLDERIHPNFKGMTMRNSTDLPFKEMSPALYLVNTDVEEGSGKHWCMLYYFEQNGRRVCEFFDSFGNHPLVYGLDSVLTQRPFDYLTCNLRAVQEIVSVVCGAHCFFYAYHRCRALSFENVIEKYSDDPKQNDEMVSDFVSQYGSVYKPRKYMMW